MSQIIRIEQYNGEILDCESVIVVPGNAVQEPGYIQPFTVKGSAHAKHEYHALAQMAYFQYQDDELEILEMTGPVIATHQGKNTTVDNGLLLCRLVDGAFKVLIHRDLNKKKLLEAVYRYCTRWVRLDI